MSSTRASASRAGPPRSHYETLGLAPSASQAEVKRAYLQEAKKCHPDVSGAPDATLRFKELARAYQVLSDPARRAEYDLRGDPEASSYTSSSAGPRGSGARRSAGASAGQPPPPPHGQEPDVDPMELFRAVLEELGAEQVASYLAEVRQEASEAAMAAQEGDLAPAKAFAWRRKGLFASVVLPAVLLLRFPAAVVGVLRTAGAIAAMSLASPHFTRTLGRFAFLRWRLLLQRAKIRARNKQK